MFEKIPESIFDTAGRDDKKENILSRENTENIIRVKNILEEKITDIDEEISVYSKMFEVSQRKLDEEDDLSLRDKYDIELKDISVKIKDLKEQKENIKKQIYIQSEN